jgi:hypothetical protein
MTGFVRLFLCSESYYLQKNVPVGRGGDKIMAYGPATDPFHGRVEVALSWVQNNVPPEATLAMLPEGAMINYLSRHVNPTRHLLWLPLVMAGFGQTNMTAAFEENSPDYVVIIARSTSEFGVGYFGYYPRYGTELKHWIDGHYDRVYPADATEIIPAGNNPFFGLQIMKRRPPVEKN